MIFAVDNSFRRKARKKVLSGNARDVADQTFDLKNHMDNWFWLWASWNRMKPCSREPVNCKVFILNASKEEKPEFLDSQLADESWRHTRCKFL